MNTNTNKKVKKMWQYKRRNHPVKRKTKWKDKAQPHWLAHWSTPRSSSSHNLCLFFHIPFWLLSFFLLLFHFFLCAISPLCHLSPLRIPCKATDGLCERWGRSQRISIYLTPACPSSSSHSLIYHTQVLPIVVWQPAPGPGLGSSRWAPVIITLGLCWE